MPPLPARAARERRVASPQLAVLSLLASGAGDFRGLQ